MSKRIGEALVEQGLITASQLDKALKAQLILGGHLGTNLIELDYVNEEAFGKTLADMLGLRYASPEILKNIEQPVIQAFSWKFAEKYKAVPIKSDERTLHVAVVDPRNLSALSTITGKKIVPWISPEIRIFEAMERYYDIPRRPRYITICHALEKSRAARTLAMSAAQASKTVASGADPKPEPSIGREIGDGDDGTGEDARTLEDFDSDFGYGRHWSEFTDDLFEASADRDLPVDRPAAKPPRRAAEAANPQGLAAAAALMSRADDKEQLARAVLDFSSRHLANSMLFSVRAETASIWDWQGPRFNRHRVSALRFPVTSGSIFTLLLGRTHFLGAPPQEGDARWLFGALQMEIPKELLLLPIYLDDRLVAIFYGDCGSTGKIEADLATYQQLTHKLGLALNMLILKLKIRAD